jgi:isoleucyl-tRNA synthetase
MIKKSELRDCVIMKLPIKEFGKKAKNIENLYPNAKVLVFCTEPWKVSAIQAVGLNENIMFVLAKWQDEYVIVADKRLGELQLRSGQKFKKLLTFPGDTLDELTLEHPLNESEVPVLINNEVGSDYGTGVNSVTPAHDLESLKIAFHYDLPKRGYVNE